MIFVTVGTHEQQFNRLLKCIDKMVEEKKIMDKVIMQTGYSTYEPKYCEYSKLIGYEDMQRYIKEADIVVTHGGPASFIDPLAVGKIPIVVPRKKDFDEHVNNHQLEFAKEVEARMKNIIVAETDEDIINSIVNYKQIIKKMTGELISNNEQFNMALAQEIESIL